MPQAQSYRLLAVAHAPPEEAEVVEILLFTFAISARVKSGMILMPPMTLKS